MFSSLLPEQGQPVACSRPAAGIGSLRWLAKRGELVGVGGVGTGSPCRSEAQEVGRRDLRLHERIATG
jgi:hypothetical protein